jgi:hypothetical protein
MPKQCGDGWRKFLSPSVITSPLQYENLQKTIGLFRRLVWHMLVANG